MEVCRGGGARRTPGGDVHWAAEERNEGLRESLGNCSEPDKQQVVWGSAKTIPATVK